jgi:hypothetical protein
VVLCELRLPLVRQVHFDGVLGEEPEIEVVLV